MHGETFKLKVSYAICF